MHSSNQSKAVHTLNQYELHTVRPFLDLFVHTRGRSAHEWQHTQNLARETGVFKCGAEGAMYQKPFADGKMRKDGAATGYANFLEESPSLLNGSGSVSQTWQRFTFDRSAIGARLSNEIGRPFKSSLSSASSCSFFNRHHGQFLKIRFAHVPQARLKRRPAIFWVRLTSLNGHVLSCHFSNGIPIIADAKPRPFWHRESPVRADIVEDVGVTTGVDRRVKVTA